MNSRGTWFWIFSGGIVGLAVSFFAAFSAHRGLLSGLGSIDRAYNYGVFWAFVLAFLLIILPLQPRLRWHLMILWIVRCFITLGVMLAYEYHYVALDMFTYFRYGREGFYDSSSLWNNGTNSVIMLIALLVKYVPFMDSYHSLKVVWSFFGLLGGYFFYLSYELITGRQSLKVLWLFCAFPSLLFWSSILGKDPIIFFGLALACYGVIRAFQKLDKPAVFAFVAGMVVVASIRMWTASVLLFAISLCFLNLKVRRSPAVTVAKLAVWCLLLFSAGVVMQNFEIEKQDDVLETVNTISRGWSKGGSKQEVPELKTIPQLVKFLPRGMFTALFRPLPGEISNVFGMVAGLENLALLVVCLTALLWMKSTYLKSKHLQFLLLTVLIWSMLYSFISYQNLGAAVRFKVQILPFILLAAALIKQKREEVRL